MLAKTPGNTQGEYPPMPGRRQISYRCDRPRRVFQSTSRPSRAEVELLSLLPHVEEATLLVENYFDRIHWFMLVFHQSDFRECFRQLYSTLERPSTEEQIRLGPLSVFAAVCVVSLQHTTDHQKVALASHGVQPEALQQNLLTTLRLRLLDVVSLGSIEAVQVCVLLGSFFLYHGEPELAWPICGCGLRIAQALNLHRSRPLRNSRPVDLDDPTQRAEETRKRCWWAVYEIETFCSMLYGFPLSIQDDDCDVELLNPYPVRSQDPFWDSATWRATGRATLLSYKYAMSQLSIIVKSALTDLYGLRQSLPQKDSSTLRHGVRLQNLAANVTSLDARLHKWYQGLPRQLHTGFESDGDGIGHFDDAASFPSDSLQRHLFQLQALALKLAFENARILVHRPLLSYKTVAPRSPSSTQSHPYAQDKHHPFQSSIHNCRDAALQISRVGSMPTFKEAAGTYAVSFISLHLFTAGVTLSIMASLDPLSRGSHESKIGIRRLMEMQSQLKTRSIVAEQGLGILKKLMSLVLAKEMEKMFEFQEGNEGEEEDPRRDHSMFETMASGNGSNDRAENESSQVDLAAADALRNLRNTGGTSRPIEGEISPAAADTTTTLPFDFYEDPIMTQALLDFEQGILVSFIYTQEPSADEDTAITHIPNESVGDDTSFSTNSARLTESCFSNQDQSWIWGPNLLI